MSKNRRKHNKEEKQYSSFNCKECRSKMVKRTSPYGQFWGCTRFPKCSNIVNIKRQEIQKQTSEIKNKTKSQIIKTFDKRVKKGTESQIIQKRSAQASKSGLSTAML